MQCPKCGTEFPMIDSWRVEKDTLKKVIDCYGCRESFDPVKVIQESGCSICTRNGCDDYYLSNGAHYPSLVCRDCDKKAVNSRGDEPMHDDVRAFGENPVFIDGVKCWRRYRHGGYKTMRDMHDLPTLKDFYEYHWGR